MQRRYRLEKSFDRIENFLSESFLECKGKRWIPLLVTRGYSVTQQQSIELKQNGIYHINDRFVQRMLAFRKERLVWVNRTLPRIV